MSKRATAPLNVAPPEEVARVEFDADMEARIGELLGRYQTKQAALLPVLWLCQQRWGWISTGMTRAIADRLELSPASIEGVLSFYTMFQSSPPGRYLVQVCTTLSCQLCGTGDLVERITSHLGVGFGETTSDGKFTLVDVQCLGACGEAPVVQINDDYYTGLDGDKLVALLDGLA